MKGTKRVRPVLRGGSLIGLAAVALIAFALPAAAQAVTVYSASSLRETLPRIEPDATYSFGGSGSLQMQIERGAPADVFVSASPTETESLHEQGLCAEPVTFATNEVAIIVPKGNPGDVTSIYSLRRDQRRIVIGAEGVPVGDYTRSVLDRLRVISILETNTVSQEPDVSGITGKVALGSAEAGFAYLTDARIAADRVEVIRLPWWAKVPVRYQACVVNRPGADTAAAATYLDVLRSGAARNILQRAGFGRP